MLYSVQLKIMYSYLNSSLKLSDNVHGLSCKQSNYILLQRRRCIFKRVSEGVSHRVLKAPEGGKHKRGDNSRSRQGVWGLLYVRFKGGFMRQGPDFSRFGHNRLLEKIFLVARGTECWTNLFSDSHDFCTFFLQHISLTLFHLCPRRFWQSTFSTDPSWCFKELCFRKDMHLI